MRQAIVDIPNNLISVQFQSINQVEWLQLLALVKSYPGRLFDGKQKQWIVPFSKVTLDSLQQNGFEIQGYDIEKPIQETPWLDIKLTEQDRESLRPYQVEALQFMIWRNGRALIADEMGVGKTIQALSYIRKFKQQRPILIVVPASVKLQWKREYEKWIGEDIEILYGRAPSRLNPAKSYIISWNLLSNKLKTKDDSDRVISEVETGWITELQNMPFKILIGDEIQAINNPKAYQTKAFYSLTKGVPAFIGLSGTPIRSFPSQFFTVLNILNEQQFPNRWKYLYRYCNPVKGWFGWTFKGITNGEELSQLIQPLMIRRLKSEILKDLPEKVRSFVPMEVEESKEYDNQEKVISNSEEKGLTLQEQIKALIYSAFYMKQKAIIGWIEDFIDTGEKLIVYAWHTAVIDLLMKHFKDKAVRIDGSKSQKDRQEAIESFQGEVPLLIGNIIALGTGIDGLQKCCSNAAFVEITAVPNDLLQCEDRLHRIGQRNSVNIYYLIAQKTIEDDLIKLIDNKFKVIEGILDGKTDTGDLIGSLIKKYKA